MSIHWGQNEVGKDNDHGTESNVEVSEENKTRTDKIEFESIHVSPVKEYLYAGLKQAESKLIQRESSDFAGLVWAVVTVKEVWERYCADVDIFQVEADGLKTSVLRVFH